MEWRFGIDCRMIGRTGIGRYIANLVRNLGPRCATLFCSDSPAAEEFRSRGYNVTVLSSGVFSLREQWEMPRAIRRRRLAVFHTPHFNIPLLSPVTQVTTIHDCTPHRFPEALPSPSARYYFRAMIRRAARHSAALIVPSNATKRDLIDYYRTPEDRIRIIPEGVDLSFFRPGGDSAGIKAALARRGLAGDPMLLYVGLSHPHKNLHRLMRALRLINEASPGSWRDLKLVCVGPSTRRFPNPSEVAQQERVGPLVAETGNIPDGDLVELMQASTLLVLPSLNEGFGLPALEAMACGLPVLVSSIPALRELAADAAEYFDPTCEAELAERLQFLLQNPSRRKELAQKGLNRAAQFSWQVCAQKTLEVYNGVAPKPEPAPTERVA
jgi:glycosyltransferase involved in cell wall biosynthesis